MSDAEDEKVSQSGAEPPQPEEAEPARRRGLPDDASVVSSKSFTSPRGKKYRIIKTTERDPYDTPEVDEKKQRG